MSSQTSTRASKTCPKKTSCTKRQHLTYLARASRRKPKKETRNSRSSGARGSPQERQQQTGKARKTSFFQDAAPMPRPPGAAVHSEATIASSTGPDHTNKEEGHRPTLRATAKEAKNFRTNSVCIPIPTTCVKYPCTRVLSTPSLPINNCKTITGNGGEGHSSFLSTQTASTRRAHSAFHSQLGSGNTRCMGVECCKRVQSRPGINTLPMPPSKGTDIWEGRIGDTGCRNRQDGTKGCYLHSRQSQPRVLLPTVCSTQKGWGPQANHQPKETKSIREVTALQDGKHKYATGHPQTRGLHDQSRSKGCLLYGASASKPPALHQIHVEGQSLPVHVPSLRVVVGPLDLYQDHKADHDCSEIYGSQDNHVYRRHTHFGRVGDSGQGTHCGTDFPTREPGTGCEPSEISNHSLPGHRIPWIQHRLHVDGDKTSRRQNQEDQGRGKATTVTDRQQRPSLIKIPGEIEPRHTGDPSSTALLQDPSELLERSTRQREPGLPDGDPVGRGMQSGTGMVGKPPDDMEWAEPSSSTPNTEDRDRRLHDRVGSVLSGGEDWWSMVPIREGNAHQLPGAARSRLSCEMFCQRAK